MPEGNVVCDACGAPASARGGTCAFCGAALPTPALPPGPALRPMDAKLRPTARFETYCPHCGQLFPTDRGTCPRCPPVEGDPKGGHCPRCGSDLSSETMAGATVDRCPSCRGLWFDRGEVNRVLDLRTQGMTKEQVDEVSRRLADRLPVAPVADASLACVRCGRMMDRRSAAPRSQILVDLCKAHGVWLDGGEFESFQAFVGGEGLEVLRQWEDTALHDAARRPKRWHQPGLSGDPRSEGRLPIALLLLATFARYR